MSQQIFNPNQAAPDGTPRKIDIDIATRLFGRAVSVHPLPELNFLPIFWSLEGDETDAGTSYAVPMFSSDEDAARLIKSKLKQMGYLVITKEMPDGQFFRTNDTGADLSGVSVVVELMPVSVEPDLRKWGTITATGNDTSEVMWQGRPPRVRRDRQRRRMRKVVFWKGGKTGQLSLFDSVTDVTVACPSCGFMKGHAPDCFVEFLPERIADYPCARRATYEEAGLYPLQNPHEATVSVRGKDHRLKNYKVEMTVERGIVDRKFFPARASRK